MKKSLTIAIGLLGLVVLAGCAATQEEFLEGAGAALNVLVEEGTLTAEQARVVMAALRGVAAQLAGGVGDFILGILDNLVTLAVGYFGIRAWRGSPTNRRGNAPKE